MPAFLKAVRKECKDQKLGTTVLAGWDKNFQFKLFKNIVDKNHITFKECRM